MAESQVPFSYDSTTIQALKNSLSESRFDTYLRKASGNETYAVALYLYNARLAKAFLFPLSVVEITVRNAVDQALLGAYGENWHQDQNLRDNQLTPQSLSSLDKAINRAGGGSRGKVIAELTFDFWSNLFRPEYSNFWRTKVNNTFTGLARNEGRQKIQSLVRTINLLRNRVAHYEPVLDVNVQDYMSKIVKLTRLRCKITSDWMKHHSTINLVIRAKPTLEGSASFKLEDRLDPNFLEITQNTSLFELSKEEYRSIRAFVCMDGNNFVGAISLQQLAQYITAKAFEEQGMIDLNDHSVATVIKHLGLTNCCNTILSNEPFLNAVNLLRRTGCQILVGMDPESRKPVGVILKSHRRY